RQQHDERAAEHRDRKRREIERRGEDRDSEDDSCERRARTIESPLLNASENAEEIAALERLHILGRSLEKEHVPHAKPGCVDSLGKIASAMKSQYLQSVALLEREPPQAVPDQRRAR